jgi:hypothetical protein
MHHERPSRLDQRAPPAVDRSRIVFNVTKEPHKLLRATLAREESRLVGSPCSR